jgi:dTDP-4-amino-4,6-dideoxygalactose transaminase
MNIPLIDLKGPYKKIERSFLAKAKVLLANQQLILGKYCLALEESVARHSGVGHAIACSNGTSALILSLMALGIKAGDEVITTPYTFFATASSVALLGAQPVFVDIERGDMNIDPALIEKAITKRTKAITVVHLFGKLCDMETICRIANKHGLAVIEDMAQSLGASRNGRQSGSFGDIASISFYPTKNLGGIGEGGMVLTRRDDLGKRARQLRVHGMGERTYHHEEIGFNARLDEIKACALLEKVPYLDLWNGKRLANGLFYNKRLKDLPLALPLVENGERSHIFHQYVIRTRSQKERDGLKTHLQTKGIGTGIYYPLPLHLQPCFANLGYKAGEMPVAEDASRTSLALPVFPELKKAEKEYVVQSIREFFSQNK